MANQEHPITPPDELVEQWRNQWMDAAHGGIFTEVCFPNSYQDMANQAAQWGWKQRDATVAAELQQAREDELEWCRDYINTEYPYMLGDALKAARRPKPPVTAEEALGQLSHLESDEPGYGSSLAIIRAALERLQQLEQLP